MFNRKELLIGLGSCVVATACNNGGTAQPVPAEADSARAPENRPAESFEGRVSRVLLATGLVAPTALILDGDNVLVGGFATIHLVPRMGGAPKKLFSAAGDSGLSHRVQRLAVCEGDVVTAFELGDWYTRIVAVSIATGQHRALVTVHGGGLGGVIGETAYVGERFSFIFGMPVIGDRVRKPMTKGVWPISVTTDDIALVFQDWWTKSVYRIVAGTTTPVLLIPGRGVAGQVITNDTHVFLSASDTIVKARKTGDGPVTVFYTSVREKPHVVACNQDFVYYTEGRDVRAISVAGGMPRTLASEVNVIAAAADFRSLYVLTDEQGSGSLHRIDVT